MPRKKTTALKLAKDKTWQAFENHLRNESVTQLRISKLGVMFTLVQRHLPVRLTEATRGHLEQFLNDLNRNKIKRQNGKPFSGSTKADVKKFLRQFFKYLRGDGEFYPTEVRWIRARIAKDELPEEKQILTIDEARALAAGFQKPSLRTLTLLLFDGGFRIQEMLSVRKQNVTWERYDDVDSCFWISCNISKTETRKIPVPLFTADVRSFFESVEFTAKKDDEPAFGVSYETYYQQLRRVSKAVLNREIGPHHLRHSSATYYSREFDGNMNLLCERYGWSFGSDIAKVYVRKSGAYQKQGVKKVFSNQVGKLENEIQQLKDQLKLITEALLPPRDRRETEEAAKFSKKEISEYLREALADYQRSKR